MSTAPVKKLLPKLSEDRDQLEIEVPIRSEAPNKELALVEALSCSVQSLLKVG